MSIASVASQWWNTKKTLYSTEDVFDDFSNIAADGNVGRIVDTIAGGTIATDTSPSEIIITCKNKKKRIHGYLSSGIKIDGKATWTPFIESGIWQTIKESMDNVSNITQTWAGASMQQPWMNRKLWVSTDPFSFDFSINLISDGNTGKTDVFLPAQALMSFVYPRSLGTADEIKKWITDNVPFLDPNGKNTKGEKNVLGSAIDTFTNAYRIPGPDLRYHNNDTESSGDAVTIVIGNLFAFGGVYLENVGLEMSNVMDSSGYPTWCKCNIKATAMDVNYVDVNGNFMISAQNNNAAALAEFLDSCGTTVIQAAADAINIAKTTIDAIKAPI